MRPNLIKFSVLSILLIFLRAHCDGQAEKRIILKLDDVIAGTDGQVISPRWQRVSDYLEGKGIKAAFGVIGFSLVKDNPAYFKWITDRADRGLIEFWNHGFWERTRKDSVGEFERSFDEQLRALRMTDSLAKVKLGLAMPVWGPHWSGTNEDTDRALSKMPQIRMIMEAPLHPVYFKGIVMTSQISLEHPIHNPDFEAFKNVYLEKKHELSLFYLQGHPLSWDEERWQNFVKIIEFLESEGVSFIKPSDILEK